MGYGRRNTTLILIMTIVSVLGLTIAFAAFSSTLTISSNATVTPDSGEFKVVFSSKSDSLSTTGVTVTKTGNATAGTPTIDNSGNPTISGISANFTSPGEKVEYTFYARNAGNYDAYLSSVVFNNIKGKTSFKECVAGTGTTSSLVASACNGIKVTTTVLSDVYTETTLNITGHTLKKNNSELVKVTIEYTSGSSVADGPFRIDFGNIYLTYGSTSISGTPTLPEEADPICKAVTVSTTGSVPMNQFAYGDEYTCDVGDGEEKTFFVLETSGDNVSLIMNANIDANGKAITSSNMPDDSGYVDWISFADWQLAGGIVTDDMKNNGGSCQYNNECETTEFGPITLNKKLKEYTSTWVSLIPSQIKIPTVYQIATAGNITDLTPRGANLSSEWLYDYLRGVGGVSSFDAPSHPTTLQGYWTSTAYSSETNDAAWYIFCDRALHVTTITGSQAGIRPVITLSKSDIQ